MSVRRCMQEVDGEEFCWWMAYDKRHPLDDRGDNWRAAKIAQTVASQYRSAALAEYLPPWGRPATPRRTWRDWKAFFVGFTGMMSRGNDRTTGNQR